MIVASYALVINIVTYVLFGFDKRAAEQRQSRIPERTLLMFSALGGSMGAVLAQQRYRHKTRKQPFRTLLLGILAAQIAMILTYFYVYT
jgi:uncharacterized membrane protein YsdA (DUF1294 family)